MWSDFNCNLLLPAWIQSNSTYLTTIYMFPHVYIAKASSSCYFIHRFFFVFGHSVNVVDSNDVGLIWCSDKILLEISKHSMNLMFIFRSAINVIPLNWKIKHVNMLQHSTYNLSIEIAIIIDNWWENSLSHCPINYINTI